MMIQIIETSDNGTKREYTFTDRAELTRALLPTFDSIEAKKLKAREDADTVNQNIRDVWRGTVSLGGVE